MTPQNYVVKGLLLPDLKLVKARKVSSSQREFHCQKTTNWEVCRKCPTKSYSVHDHRLVVIKDQKLRNKKITLVIRKRRFRCPNSKAVFTESIDGIKCSSHELRLQSALSLNENLL